MSARTFFTMLAVFWALAAASMVVAQEPPDPTREQLAAKRAYLRAAAKGVVETATARERLLDPETGHVSQRLCGLAPDGLGLPAAFAGVRLCLHREWAASGVKILRGLTREDTGMPVGPWRRWTDDGTPLQVEVYDAQGRLHGRSWYGPWTTPEGESRPAKTLDCVRGECAEVTP